MDCKAGKGLSFKETARLSSTMITPLTFPPAASLPGGGISAGSSLSFLLMTPRMRSHTSYWVELGVLAPHMVNADQTRGACALFQVGRPCLPYLAFSEPPREGEKLIRSSKGWKSSALLVGGGGAPFSSLCCLHGIKWLLFKSFCLAGLPLCWPFSEREQAFTGAILSYSHWYF